MTLACLASVPFGERNNLMSIIFSNFSRPRLIKQVSESLSHYWKVEVSNRQPQVTHIKWENQEAAANMSDLVAYIVFFSYTQREK